jgi:uncharacterized protein (DUF1501 family)
MTPISPHGLGLLNRRRFLSHMGTALGGLSLLQLLDRDGLLAAGTPLRPTIDPARPYAARAPHFAAPAKQVVVIYCVGAVSHVDSFDYKPALFQHHGQTPPNAPEVTFQGPIGKLAKPLWEFKPRGQSGKMISELFPRLAEQADELCFIHSLVAKSSAHTQAENFMSTGQTFEGHPSLGAWATYALGTANENLPAFVAIPDPRGRPQAGYNNWGPGYLPAAFQGTAFTASQPLRNLAPPAGTDARANTTARDLLAALNEEHLTRFPGDTDLAARIASYELAGHMQLSVPEVGDLSQESEAMQEAYGANSPDKTKAAFARNCLLARRLLERGVRVVQLFNGGSGDGGRTNWDGHSDILKNHGTHAAILDQPVAALLDDLRQRGLLDHTLVVWCTEFGRMPFMQANGTGRDHNIDAFTCFLAGAGVKRGFSYGSSDELGWKAVENKTTIYDFNATILHLLGLDHERLTYYHNGLERRLTDVHGHVIDGLLA